MLAFTQLDAMSGSAHDIETLNPAMVSRLRAQAARLDHYQIAVHLADAIAAATDAAHISRWQEHAYGEASPEAMVDQEYHDDLVSAWTLIAAEHQLVNLDVLFADDRSFH